MNKNKSFSHDVLTLASVPVISQIFGVLLTPIVTRMYLPEAFGLANLLGSFVMTIAVFSTMGYHGAIILPKNDATATNILILCFLSIFCVSAISFLIIMVAKDIIAVELNSPSLVNYLWLTPIFVFLHGLNMTLRYWTTRLRQFNSLAASRISEIVVRKTYQISAGFLGFATAESLIYASIATGIVKSLVLIRGLELKTITLNYFYTKLKVVAIRYKKFPQFSIWADLFSRIPAVIISIFIIKYFGQSMLGFYALSLMVLSLPSTLISGSISEAFSPRVAMAKHNNKQTEMLEKLYVRLVAIMIFPFLILGIFGDRLFLIVFGPEWMQSGIIAQILVIRIFLEIIFSPSLSLVAIMNRQELNLISSIASSLISVIAMLLGAYYNNFYLALWCLVILEGATITILSSYMMRFIHFPFIHSMKKLSKYVFISIFIGFSTFLIGDLFPVNNIYFISTIFFSFLIYYSLVAYWDREMTIAIAKSIRSFVKI